MCADGGANRLYDELPGMLPGQAAAAVRAQYLPTAIQGDLDSIRPDVLDFYRQHGVPVHDLSGTRHWAPAGVSSCKWAHRGTHCHAFAPLQPTRTAPTCRSASILCGSMPSSGGWTCGT